jgi:prolyl 4-hydroxylase
VSTDAGAALFEAMHFFAVEHFLSGDECLFLREVMRAAPAADATVARGSTAEYRVEDNLRRTRRVNVGDDAQREFIARLDAIRDAAAAHFGVTLSETETPQFLLYRPGDFFVRHADRDRAGTNRRAVSIIVFLNEDYSGGALKFFGDELALSITPVEGLLIGFRSETPHEVEAVQYGERFTVVSWFA